MKEQEKKEQKFLCIEKYVCHLKPIVLDPLKLHYTVFYIKKDLAKFSE